MLFFDTPPLKNITLIFEEGSFVPLAKITKDDTFSIVSDYLGTPCLMYNSVGNLVWQADLDIYGKVRTLSKGNINDCPFRYQGQYHDTEIDLYYNRFRYYSPESGTYVSQDPIGLIGGDRLYSYPLNVNCMVDIFGLTVSVGQVGDYGVLSKLGDVGDDLEYHHIPQDKLGHLPRNEGVAVVMPKAEHAQTRTYKSRGRATAVIDRNRAFQDVLKDDLVDIRQIGGAKYDDAIEQIIESYENKGLLKKGDLSLDDVIASCN